MDEYSEVRWNETLLKVSHFFKVTADYEFMLFIIGLHERGTGFKHYSKEEKMDLMNLGQCILFSQLGYLKATGLDSDNWPQFEHLKPTHSLTPSFRKNRLRAAMITYFDKMLAEA